MSVLIKGMEMPKNCYQCRMVDSCQYLWKPYDLDDYSDLQNMIEEGFTRADNCPLVEVPPHGRLIDADALHKLFEDQWHYLQVLDWNENPTAEARQSGVNWCINTMHDSAPTIIEAEEGE